jgi:hypothetical protein
VGYATPLSGFGRHWGKALTAIGAWSRIKLVALRSSWCIPVRWAALPDCWPWRSCRGGQCSLRAHRLRASSYAPFSARQGPYHTIAIPPSGEAAYVIDSLLSQRQPDELRLLCQGGGSADAPQQGRRHRNGVKIGPGPTAFTRMPSGEWSAASARVKPATAAFVVSYCRLPPPATTERTEATLTLEQV